MEVRLSKEQRIQVRNADDVFKIMRQILRRENRFGRNKEHFWTLGLAPDQQILYIELVSLGSGNKAIVAPDEVFQLAVHKNASSVILVHNHPSGHLQPSAEDRDLTDQLIQAGRIIRKEVIDHFIISETAYFSFALEGVMLELQASKKYQIGYLEVERIKQESESLGEERGRYAGAKAQARDMARAMKADGQSLETILKYTQLSLAEVEQL